VEIVEQDFSVREVRTVKWNGREYQMNSAQRRGLMARVCAGFIVIAALVVSSLSGPRPADAADEKALLAPSGHLRVGVYPGSPTSMVSDPNTQQTHGVTYDLGKEFADKLGVPVEYVTFKRIADVIDAIKEGQVDFTVTNATPVRAEVVAFSQTLLAVELGYLVPANSKIERPEAIDGPGVRIGVTKGGTSERVLGEKFTRAKFVAAESIKAAIDGLRSGEIDVYATNKAILFEMSQSLPGSRVLDASWGQEHMAIAVPKGREAASPLLNQFVDSVQASGRLTEVESAAGLKGVAKLAKD
jgi:polar amino acid transport system substrate-binding protein